VNIPPRVLAARRLATGPPTRRILPYTPILWEADGWLPGRVPLNSYELAALAATAQAGSIALGTQTSPSRM
jgi:hypothetical protein